MSGTSEIPGELDELDALLKAITPSPASARAKDCPSEDELRLFLDGLCTARQYTGIRRHVEGCDLCGKTIRRLSEQERSTPQVSPSSVLGKGLGVALIGPPDAPHREIRSLLRARAAQGDTVSPLSARPWWVSRDLSSDELEAPVDASKLSRWVNALMACIDPDGGTGILLSAGPGLQGARGPFGPAYDDGFAHATAIRGGELCSTPAVRALLEPLGVRFRRSFEAEVAVLAPVRRVAATATCIASVGLASALPSGADARGGTPVRAGYIGQLDPLRGVWFSRTLRSLARNASPSILRASDRGETLHLTLESPSGCWFYLIGAGEQGLRLPYGEPPLRTPEMSTLVELQLPSEPESSALYLLESLDPLPDLAGLIALAAEAAAQTIAHTGNPAQSQTPAPNRSPPTPLEAQRSRLLDLLLERHPSGSFALIPLLEPSSEE